MGYDLHITRAADWTQSESNPITEAEWEAHVALDPELLLTGAAETSTPGGPLGYRSAGLAVWTRHPSGETVWFDCRDGAVVVKNPDAPTIAKMMSVARAGLLVVSATAPGGIRRASRRALHGGRSHPGRSR